MSIIRRCIAPLAVCIATLVPSLAAAQEVSVSGAYDRLYGTSFSSQGGLAALRAQAAARTRGLYTVRELRFIDVIAYDTAGTSPLYLVAEGRMIPIFDPGPWTPPSRGFRPRGGHTIDVAATLARHGIDPSHARFGLSVDGVMMSAQNTHTLRGARGGEFLLAYNGGGLDHEDADANEPLLRCRGGARFEAPGVYAPPPVVTLPSAEEELPMERPLLRRHILRRMRALRPFARYPR